jgi:flagellar protein FlbD
MIKLTRLQGKEFYLNADIIEMIEATPDTVITLLDGTKYVVKEDIEEVINRIIQYKREVGYGFLKIMTKDQDKNDY